MHRKSKQSACSHSIVTVILSTQVSVAQPLTMSNTAVVHSANAMGWTAIEHKLCNRIKDVPVIHAPLIQTPAPLLLLGHARLWFICHQQEQAVCFTKAEYRSHILSWLPAGLLLFLALGHLSQCTGCCSQREAALRAVVKYSPSEIHCKTIRN